MLGILQETWRSRELLWAMVEREIKTRYRRSFLGLLWSLITPLYQVVLMTVVVKFIWQKPDPDYSIKFLCGLLPWTFFATGITTSCASFLRARQLVKRVKLPRQVIPWAVVGSCLFHYVVSMVVLLLLLVVIPLVLPGDSIRPVWLSWQSLFLPVLMFLQVLMVMGISLVTSTLHTVYHDVEYVVTNLVAAFYFLTPVIWHLDTVWVQDERLAFWAAFNPMATFCEGSRSIILRHELPEPVHLLSTAVFSVLCFLVGLWYFRRREWQLPEVV